MKYFLVFLLVCFLAGWLLNRLSLKQMTALLVVVSLGLVFGYFFLDFI
jgi:hypothetical protein